MEGDLDGKTAALRGLWRPDGVTWGMEPMTSTVVMLTPLFGGNKPKTKGSNRFSSVIRKFNSEGRGPSPSLLRQELDRNPSPRLKRNRKRRQMV